jgi:hypothetical protein
MFGQLWLIHTYIYIYIDLIEKDKNVYINLYKIYKIFLTIFIGLYTLHIQLPHKLSYEKTSNESDFTIK